jgi:hypothetical protein
MKLIFRLVINIIGYGFVLNQYIVQYLESTYLRREKYASFWEIYSFVSQKNGKHTVYNDGGTLYYDEACDVLWLKHYLHSPLEKNLMERVNQYFKDRIENFNDYYPCMKSKCNTFLVNKWIQFFVSMYNYTTFENCFVNELNNRGEYIPS